MSKLRLIALLFKVVADVVRGSLTSHTTALEHPVGSLDTSVAYKKTLEAFRRHLAPALVLDELDSHQQCAYRVVACNDQHSLFTYLP